MLISRTDLNAGLPRQRTSINKGPLADLYDSILTTGLFHAPVVRHSINDEQGPYVLVAGERRLRAIDQIAEKGLMFTYDTKLIAPGEVPVTIIDHGEAVKYLEAELEENLIREDLSWQDRIAAISKIHELRKANNPAQTVSDTARELEQKGGISTGNKSVEGLHREITEASIIAPHLSDPTISNARSASEAFNMVVKKEEAKFHAELIRRRQTTTPPGHQPDASHRVILGDAKKILPTLGTGEYDLILTDPPYGIGADSAGFRQRSSVGGHHYSDDESVSREITQLIFLESFRLAKNRANLFMFLDIDLFSWAKSTAQNIGWTVFRTPLSWIKSDSEGMAPWGSSGPRRTVEWILYATKGQRGLIHSPIDALRYARVSRVERTYGPEKPVDLLQFLIECSTLVGDTILDPCCGTGSTIEAARRSRRRATGIEIDENAFNVALHRTHADLPPNDEGSAPLVTNMFIAPADQL